MKKEGVIVEKTYHAPIAKVWKAITDKRQMKQWYFDLSSFKPEVGFEFQFLGKGNEGETYLHLCRITEVIFQKKLVYSWCYDGYEGNSLVTFELFSEGKNTKLVLTHMGLETFPVGFAFAKENFEEGWTHLVQVLLKEFLKEK